MRILVISNLFPPAIRGGYENECAGVVSHLRKRGDEVTVLTSTHGRRRKREESVLRKLPLLPQTPVGSLRAPLSSVFAASTVRATIAVQRPELIFIWNGAAIPHSSIYVALESGIPVAFRVCEHWFGRLFESDQFTRHLRPGDRGPRRAWASLVRGVNRARPLQIDLDHDPFPVSISWNSAFIRTAAPPPRLLDPLFERVIRSTSLNGSRFESVGRHSPAGRPRICFVGRLSSEKGPEIAVRAVAALRDRHGIEAELILAGAGTRAERRRLMREAETVGVSGLCSIAGRLGSADLAQLFSRSDALVMPSLWAEPFPLVTIEGALARVPVVASRTGGIPEQLEDGIHALFFEPGDFSACADAIAETLRRPAETAARVEAAFTRATSLSWGKYLRETDEFISATMATLAR